MFLSCVPFFLWFSTFSSLIGLELRKLRAALAEGLYGAFEEGVGGACVMSEESSLDFVLVHNSLAER